MCFTSLQTEIKTFNVVINGKIEPKAKHVSSLENQIENMLLMKIFILFYLINSPRFQVALH